MTSTRKRAYTRPPTAHARMKIDAKPTLAQELYRSLREEILSLERVPGAPISETDLATQYGVSRTPIREALLRLAKENLVEVAPKSGTFVARIPVSHLPESVIARRALECVIAKSAAKYASRSQILELNVQIERQKECAQQGDLGSFHRADEGFHEAIAQAGRLPGLWVFAQQIKVQMDRFRLLTLPEPGRMDVAIVEHEAIVAAIESGDGEAASEAIDRHLSSLQLRIKQAVETHSEYFILDADLDELVTI